jgi:clan AA aspartic protease (TIGR02281 family)
MICRRCRSENPDDARFCSKCGNLLARKPAGARRQPPWYVFLAGALALLTAGFFLSRIVFRSPGEGTTRSAAAEAATAAPAPATVHGPGEAGPVAVSVVIESPYGRETSRWTSAVVGGSWVALPAWALLGGGKLTLSGEGTGPVSMDWAVWTSRDPVALCRLDAQNAARPPRLSAWRRDAEVQWTSLVQDGASYVLGRISPGREGAFFYFPLPEEIRTAGLFVQNGAVVGWTFGQNGERGYLWSGAVDLERAPRTSLRELSGTILAGCREARFSRILDLEGTASPVLQLQALAEAFRSEPAFEEKDVPASLRAEGVAARMHAAASTLIQDGSAADVARFLDDATLEETRSPALARDAVLALVRMRGHENAILELERLEKKTSIARFLRPAEWSQFKLELYREWLRETIDRRRAGGLDAFEKAKLAFPNDVEIHLMGVEIAIQEKNWARASEFLAMRQYPEALAGRAKMLENLIQEGQKDEGVAVLRFDPGTDHIPVEAYVNGAKLQKFILDTGATMSSIPWSAVEALGIKVDDSTKVIVVEGIAGRGLTYEVTLDSIELAGLRVYNVKAFIADMPSYENTGILGQNVLNNFQLDIDYKKGILRIRKR